VSNNVEETLARHWGDGEKCQGDTMGHLTTLRRHQGHEATQGNIGETMKMLETLGSAKEMLRH
jgi:hypothetical protein